MAGGTIILVDCARLQRPDLQTVESIARLTLAARAEGLRLRFEKAPEGLRGLMELCGLAALLVEVEGKAEEREEAGGVEEEGDVRDPPL